MKRWSEETRIGKMKLVAFSLIPMVLLVGCAELIAGLTIRRDIGVETDPATGRRTYTMRIGRVPWGREGVTPLNELGFPDDEFDEIGPKGDCLHVVFSGDSYVFGDGVDRDDSFFQLVKRAATGRVTHRCVRFFNIAERSCRRRCRQCRSLHR